MMAASQRSLMTQAMKSVDVEKRPTPAASPSRPSIRLKALLMPTNQITVRGAERMPKLEGLAASSGLEMAVIW